MTKKLLTIIKYLLVFGGGIFLLWLAFRNQNFGKIRESLASADYKWIGLSVFVSVFSFISRAYRWNLLIRPLNHNPSLSSSTYSLMVGYLANYAIPRLGEVTRCAMLSRAEKIPLDKLIGTVIAERAFDLLTLIIILTYLGLTQFEIIGNFLINQVVHPLLEKISFAGEHPILIGSMVVLILGVTFFVIQKNKNKSGNKGLISKVSGFAASIGEGIRSVFQSKQKGKFLLHTVIIWLIYLMSTWLCFFAFPATSHLNWEVALFTLAIGGIGMTVPVQGGIGAFHWMVSQGLILYGIGFEDGLVYATVIHASQTIFIILFGGVSYLLLFLKNR